MEGTGNKKRRQEKEEESSRNDQMDHESGSKSGISIGNRSLDEGTKKGFSGYD